MSVRTLVVYSTPVPKARPRATIAGGRARVYTPPATKQAEWEIRQAWIAKYGDAEPMRGPVMLTFTARLPMPASMPKKYRATARPAKKPDLPNLLMALADALSRHAYADDAQVVSVVCEKRYTAYGESPRWEISVEEIA